MQRTWAGYMTGWVCGAALCAGCVPTETEIASQRAAVLGQSGDHTVSGQEVVNAYAVLSVSAPAGSQSITVQDLTPLSGIKAGDVVMIIQMQGADIDQLSDSAAYGTILNVGDAGHYEFLTVNSADPASGTIQIHGHGSGGLQLDYSAGGHTQVIAVPQYHNLTVPMGAVVNPNRWNGSTGGVVAIIADTLQLDGQISASGMGFRGGQLQNGAAATYLGYRTGNVMVGGERGESIGGSQADYDLMGGRFGRGAAANGGGGGDSINASGGGGANGLAMGKTWTGQGVMDTSVASYQTAWMLDPAYNAGGGGFSDSAGGGRGGYACSTGNLDPTMVAPGAATWGCGNRNSTGGLGGRPLLGDVRSRLYFGGGGGAGQENDQNGGFGGTGGGLVFVLANTIQGQGQVSADGNPGGAAGTKASAPGGDGPGGGGGGGTVVLMATQSISALQVSAAGGPGGNHSSPNPMEGEGGGGGGGGGYVALVGTSMVQAVVPGGPGGKTSGAPFTAFPLNGATGGEAGAMNTGNNLGPNLLPPVLAVDMQVTLGLGSTTRPGYTQAPLYATYTNNGPDTANNVQATVTLPAGISGTVARTDQWVCTPSMQVQAGQTVTCTLTSLPPGQSEIIEIDLALPRVDPSAQYSFTAAVSGGGFDYVATNNQATESLTIDGYAQLSGYGFGCAMSGHAQSSSRAWWLLLLVPLALWRHARRTRLLLAWLLAASACSPTPPPQPNVQIMVMGQGMVTSADGSISCGSQCQTMTAPGTVFQLTATPAAGQAFMQWDGRCQGTVPSCDLSVYTDATATATFAPVALTCFDGILNEGETDIDCGGPCASCQDGRSCMMGTDCQSAQCADGICSSCRIGQELVVNGDAESGPSPLTFLPGWQTSPGLAAIAYGTAGFPAVTDPGPANRGTYLFYGGTNIGAAIATQSVDLDACATLIDKGKISYTLSGYLGGQINKDDFATFAATFRDAQDNTTTQGTIGPVSKTDRTNLTGLLQRTATADVPAGTRQVLLTLKSVRVQLPTDDGYADNLSLMLTLKP